MGRYNIGYEDTDKKLIVNIYGLDFEIKSVSKEMVEEYNKLVKNEVKDFKELEKYIDLFLGEGASDKINDKRKQDGYHEMDLKVIVSIIGLIVEVVSKDMTKSQETSINNINNNYHRNYRTNYNNYRGRRY